MEVNLSCIIPLVAGLVLLLVFVAVARRIMFVADEIALVGLMYSGLREVLGPRRVFAGTVAVILLAFGFVVFIVLLALSASSCVGANPSAFCNLVGTAGR